jgi:hypothetical protein
MKRIVSLLIALSTSCSAPESSHELASERRYLEPDLVIGSYDEENYSLSAVAGLTVDPLGRIYVLEQRPPEVRVYEPGGAFVRTLGRRGEGPGEFLMTGGLGWIGDTLFFTVVPKRLRILGATATTVWGVLPDSLDVPFVIRYRVTGGTGSIGLSKTLRAPG